MLVPYQQQQQQQVPLTAANLQQMGFGTTARSVRSHRAATNGRFPLLQLTYNRWVLAQQHALYAHTGRLLMVGVYGMI